MFIYYYKGNHFETINIYNIIDINLLTINDIPLGNTEFNDIEIAKIISFGNYLICPKGIIILMNMKKNPKQF